MFLLFFLGAKLFVESPLFFIFLKKSFFHLFIPFCKTFFWWISFFCFTLFSFFFQSCSFEQDERDLFFLTQKQLFKPFQEYIFSQFLSFDIWKEQKFFNHFSVFFFFFEKNPFFQKKQKKLIFLIFLENPFWPFLLFWITSFSTKIAFVTKMFLSMPHFVIISWNPHALRIARAIEGSLDYCWVSWRSWAS